MKPMNYLLLAITGICLTGNALAQNEGCEKVVNVKSAPLIAARSIAAENKFEIKAGQRFYIPSVKQKKSSNKKSCTINLYNEVDQDVDVFVDANYMGSIKAGTQGVVKSAKGYETVYCVSTDKMMTWTQVGDCSCVYVFKLQK